MINNLINDFSDKYWSDIINFQSTWWNISYKEDGFLYIKSSWYKISKINKNKAISKIDIKGFFVDYKNISDISEDILSTIIEKNNLSDKKASLETWFHLLLSKYVIHSHNIYANILTCSKEWESILKDIFWDECQFIDYASPWLFLFKKIEKQKGYKKNIFLKNHWIISHSDWSFEDAYNNIKMIDCKIKSYFDIGNFNLKKKLKDISKYLFPDMFVLKNDIENYSVHSFIEEQIKKFWLNPNYLSDSQLDYLGNMRQEKYRKKLYNNELWL